MLDFTSSVVTKTKQNENESEASFSFCLHHSHSVSRSTLNLFEFKVDETSHSIPDSKTLSKIDFSTLEVTKIVASKEFKLMLLFQ